MRLYGLLALAACFWAVLAPTSGPGPDSIPATAPASRPGEAAITFFAISDTHVGGLDTAKRNPALIRMMNELPGKDWPGPLSGTIDRPVGVLACGDLTNSGATAEWQQFQTLFLGKPGEENPLPGPLLECTGNHDREVGRRVVLDAVRKRHGSLHYTADLGHLKAISMDMAANPDGVKWLRTTLADVPKDQPIVLFMHYPFAFGGQPSAKDRALLDALQGYRVAAILYGHIHGFGYTEVEGIPVLNLPTVRGDHPGAAVVRVSADHVDIAYKSLENGGWFVVKSVPLAPPVKPQPQPATKPATRPSRRSVSKPAA